MPKPQIPAALAAAMAAATDTDLSDDLLRRLMTDAEFRYAFELGRAYERRQAD